MSQSLLGRMTQAPCIQFGGNSIAVSGIAVCYSCFESFFTFPAIVHIRCIKIGIARFQKTVSHLYHLGNINSMLPSSFLGRRINPNPILNGFSLRIHLEYSFIKEEGSVSEQKACILVLKGNLRRIGDLHT